MRTAPVQRHQTRTQWKQASELLGHVAPHAGNTCRHTNHIMGNMRCCIRWVYKSRAHCQSQPRPEHVQWWPRGRGGVLRRGCRVLDVGGWPRGRDVGMVAAGQAQRRCWLHDDTKGAARWGVAARGSGWLRGGLQPHQGPAPAARMAPQELLAIRAPASCSRQC